jgi:hypothetical protein
LSPYLFIICVEGLSAMLQKAYLEGKIKGIMVCREAPRINHLFFVDDSLVPMHACRQDAQELRRILREKASGQMLNTDKSSNLFIPNIKGGDREAVR